MNILDIDKYTGKEVYEFVRNHLLTQMEFCGSPESVCLYRNKTGLSCAVGCLMTDEQCGEADELGNDWSSTLDRLYKSRGLTNKHRDLLSKLQKIHDTSNVCNWEDDLNELAQQEGFNE